MNKLSRVIAMAIFGLSSSAFAAEDESRGNRALSNLDTDGDGFVNFEEFQARGAEGLSRLDNDENGVLTLDELLNARPGHGRGPGPRSGNRGDRNTDRPEREPSEEQIARMEERRASMTERATARFQEMDRDGNDVVSLEEFQEANFLELDEDNNGLLSTEELRARHNGRRGPGRSRGGRPPQA
ncbi:MAG: EF-hand domain-containing protein [Gammaproteobacteria bacterium]|nr:EF-hand domain-containing protein [Gammaproteobacteria bacterium]